MPITIAKNAKSSSPKKKVKSKKKFAPKTLTREEVDRQIKRNKSMVAKSRSQAKKNLDSLSKLEKGRRSGKRSA